VLVRRRHAIAIESAVDEGEDQAVIEASQGTDDSRGRGGNRRLRDNRSRFTWAVAAGQIARMADRGRRLMVTAACVAALSALAGGTRAEPRKKEKKALGTRLIEYLDPRTTDREAARELAPVTLGDMAPRRATGEGRVVRVRVYADDDYRAATLRWQKKVERQLDRVNRVVEPAFNVRFELESARKWPRSHAGVGLSPLLDELEALDPGADVDWVVGYVTAFRGVTTSIHQLALAQLVSKHFVMRGMDDQEEGRVFAAAFGMMPASERETLYEERKAHKELVLFLHEWAHTLGAMHAESEALVMNPAYDPKQSGFSEFEARCMSVALNARLADRAKAYPESAALLALLRDAPPGEGRDADRAQLRAMLEARAGGSTAKRSGRRELPISEEEVAAYNAAVGALDANRPDEAWAKAAPVFARYPRDPRVTGLACSMVAGHPKAAEATARCDAAMKLAPRDVDLPLAAATAHVNAGAPVAAAPLLELAFAMLASGNGAPDQAGLARLARVALGAGSLTTAQDAAAKAGGEDARKLTAEVETHRRRWALPAGQSGVAPEHEAEYVQAFRALASMAPKAPEWGARFAALEARFPEAPGTKLLACERELAARHVAAAIKLCETAVARAPEAVRGHYVLAVIAMNARRIHDAEKSFRKALLLDPEDPMLWRELASFYKATRSPQKLEQLAQEHQALLSRPLPR
jgi:predicted Zn-dependent protease